MTPKEWDQIRRLVRTASTTDAPASVQDAADDLFDCACAFAEDDSSLEARRLLLTTALRLVKSAINDIDKREGRR